MKREAKPIKYEVFFSIFEFQLYFHWTESLGKKIQPKLPPLGKRCTHTHTHIIISIQYNHADRVFELLFLLLRYTLWSKEYAIRYSAFVYYFFSSTQIFTLAFKIPIFVRKIFIICVEHLFLFALKTFLFSPSHK